MTLQKVNNHWQQLRTRIRALARFSDYSPAVSDNITSRRDILRGVLITGCGLLVPIAFVSCELQTGSKPASTRSDPAPFTRPRYRAAVPTSSLQISVHYQAQPHGKQQCGNCQHFVTAANACKRVDGRISTTGWCDLWTRKS